VKKQDKIALAILVIGLAVIGIYKFASKEGQKIDGKPLQTTIQEQIILPQYPAERYRSIPEVQHYLSDLKEMITKGISVLPLDDDELDETTRKIQALLLKDPQFLADTRQNGKILHNDMMRIVPALSSYALRAVPSHGPDYSAERTLTTADVPTLLNELPNVHTWSLAGNGIGYSYLSIRGFPQERIAVTVNGIPLNDPETHMVYWIDMPDLMESVEDIQVQRGVEWHQMADIVQKENTLVAPVRTTLEKSPEETTEIQTRITLQHEYFLVGIGQIPPFMGITQLQMKQALFVDDSCQSQTKSHRLAALVQIPANRLD